MEEKLSGEFEYFLKDGKPTRRTFVKGAGLITVSSMMGFAPQLSGCSNAGVEEGATAGEEKTIHANCTYNCNSDCMLKGTLKDGKIIRVEPGEMPNRPDYATACLRGTAYPQKVQSEKDRVMYPMKRTGERGSGEFERITWDEAIDTVAEKLKAVLDVNPKAASFYRFTGNHTKLASESLARMARLTGATTWLIEAIMGDHGASMGMDMVYGAQRAGHDMRDYMNSDLIIFWSGNSADTHTSIMRYILNAKENGAKFIVIDPRLSSTASLADQWIPIRPQTDPVLALAMMKIIIENDLHDETWLANYSCAPLLVRDDNGEYLHPSEGMYAAWDTASNAMVMIDPADAGGLDDQTSGPESTLAMDGSYTVDGVACHPTYVDLLKEIDKYDLEYASNITGLDPDVIEGLALEYGRANVAAIRMSQGSQRVFYSFAPLRTIATLAAITGNVGKSGGGASHVYSKGPGNPAGPLKKVDYDGPVFNFAAWAGGGSSTSSYAAAVAMAGTTSSLKSSWLYDAAINSDPVPIDFLYIGSSNFINMSPDANKIINEVIPAIDFIVTIDPFWTWTCKYSDIVLPGTTYWENWDIQDLAPFVTLNQPSIPQMGESKSDCETMSLIAAKIGLEADWSKTDEEWVREFLTSDHPAIANLDFEQLKENGIYAREDGIFDPIYSWGDKKFATKSARFEFYTDRLYQFGQQVPTYMRMCEDPEGPLGEKYPLVFIQYHDRLNVHSQHILPAALRIVENEPHIQINPVDAEARGLNHGDVVRMFNDRGYCKAKVFLTEGIVPGVVAMLSGWTPDYFIEGSHQFLTHYTKNEVEEFYSQTNAAFYDVLVQVEKA